MKRQQEAHASACKMRNLHEISHGNVCIIWLECNFCVVDVLEMVGALVAARQQTLGNLKPVQNRSSPLHTIWTQGQARDAPRSAAAAENQVRVAIFLPLSPTSRGTATTVKVPVKAPCDADVMERPIA